ncbi:hypothetical protein CBM2634_A160013 [Cupriavidus taiwanensis]|uniref:Uncharacterized protein n=1 Tax=Cupriavidus taiwanensis TaxID=164546 RepID=A0A375IVM5_9BURK|nr:hypothetical protein CBM2634_A160013 [Cupriavidus taiwanensis]
MVRLMTGVLAYMVHGVVLQVRNICNFLYLWGK